MKAEDEVAVLTLTHPDYPGMVFIAEAVIAKPSPYTDAIISGPEQGEEEE